MRTFDWHFIGLPYLHVAARAKTSTPKRISLEGKVENRSAVQGQNFQVSPWVTAPWALESTPNRSLECWTAGLLDCWTAGWGPLSECEYRGGQKIHLSCSPSLSCCPTLTSSTIFYIGIKSGLTKGNYSWYTPWLMFLKGHLALVLLTLTNPANALSHTSVGKSQHS